MFHLDWGVHINSRVVQLGMVTEMLEKLPLPRDTVVATQCNFPDLKGLFASSLM